MANRIVVGAQWGDEGKAKVVDYLTSEADIVVRFQGGANAGHTVEVGDTKFIFHLIPAGIMHKDKICVIGNGVVLDPQELINELNEVQKKGVDVEGRLLLSRRAHVVMPYHKIMDNIREKSLGDKKIGTTGRGIGPAYADKIARMGIRASDLANPDTLKNKVEKILKEKNKILQCLYGTEPLKLNDMVDPYIAYSENIKSLLTDTSDFLNKAIKNGKSLLFEGAQGTLLDVDHGTFPFVTSSNTVAAAACIGSGIGPT
ncbi:MAG: adenylosuccinate synthetase, partial [bacterium]